MESRPQDVVQKTSHSRPPRHGSNISVEYRPSGKPTSIRQAQAHHPGFGSRVWSRVNEVEKENPHVRNVVPLIVSVASCSPRLVARPHSVANLLLEHGPERKWDRRRRPRVETRHASCPFDRRWAQDCYQRTCLSAAVSFQLRGPLSMLALGEKEVILPQRRRPPTVATLGGNDLPHLPRLRRCGGLALRRRGGAPVTLQPIPRTVRRRPEA